MMVMAMELPSQITVLLPEWKRIELLAQCLLESRAGREVSDSLIQQLKHLQHQIERLRKEPKNWGRFLNDDFPDLALDILAGVYAPAILPNVALLFQDLQKENAMYPTVSFLCRLLALNDHEYLLVQHLLERQGPLMSKKLLLVEGVGVMQQLKPQPSLVSLLSGLPQEQPDIPGATPIHAEANWDDLVISASQKKSLREYVLWIKHGNKVVSDWGGIPSGGPVALFSGHSGTGKTFSATVIANELGWPLYRVDLGALISKYIGETEKNLNALFEAAHEKKIILQFDEVDALMGKRGDIKDARDRYANMEVSHLLSRIEQHHGPCILTTNLRKQVDPAFQRRFHFVVVFPKPEAQEREALWRRLLPPRAPVSKEVDFNMVAEAVPLTGGEIRNAVNHAAIMASAESTEIDLVHIAAGVWRVLQKTEGQTRPSQLKGLADYLPKEVISGEME